MKNTVLERPVAKSQTSLKSEYVMTMHVPGGDSPLQIDSTLRIHRAGQDGWLRGPNIDARIIQPTADWLHISPDGTLRVDARVTAQTSDGAAIFISYNGIIRVSRENFERMTRGDELTSNDMYFVIAPTFQTSHKNYVWLNHAQFAGKVVSLKGGEGGHVRYDIFSLT